METQRMTDEQILRKVHQVSTTTRNPDHQDNRRRMKGGKICNEAAKPSDLGATKRNQWITTRMFALAKAGYLKRIDHLSNFPYFRVVDGALIRIKLFKK